jgi:hypothetical protein
MQRTKTAGGYIRIALLGIAIVVIAVVALILIHHKHDTSASSKQATNLQSYCVGQTFANGSSGHCVSDIQTIINYMEHSGLTQCPFVNGAKITVDSTYDADTITQVNAVQRWASCYAKQEGFTSNVPQNGTVGKATWGELCTYGYTDPMRSEATKTGTTIAAGKDAGCERLQS